MKSISFFIFVFFVFLFGCNGFQGNDSKKTEGDKLIVYGSATCHYCVDTKVFLKENNIPFIFHDLDTKPLKIKEMYGKLTKAGFSLSNFQIPVVDKSGVIITNEYDTFEIFLNKLK